MLTIMCPNCRLRFPAPGCCGGNNNNSGIGGFAVGESGLSVGGGTTAVTTTGSAGGGGGGGFGGGSSSATVSLDHLSTSASGGGLLLVDASGGGINNQHRQQVTISTQCGIQSGGCLIQSSNAEVLLSSSGYAPRLEVRSKLTGGGCFVEKRIEDLHGQQGLVVEMQQQQQLQQQQQDQCIIGPLLISEEQLRASFEQAAQFHRSHSATARLDPPPSGCQELPGTRREGGSGGSVGGPSAIKDHHHHHHHHHTPHHQRHNHHQQHSMCCECRCCCYCRHCCTSSGYSKRKHQAAATATTTTTAPSSSTVEAPPPSVVAEGDVSSSSDSPTAGMAHCPRNLCQVASSDGGMMTEPALDHPQHGLARCCSNGGRDCRADAETDDDQRTGRAQQANVEMVDGGSSKYPGDVRIHVNATVHLPATSSTTMGSCTFNITASTTTAAPSTTDCCGGAANSGCPSMLGGGDHHLVAGRPRNNFNGGGIVTTAVTADVVGSVNSNVSNISSNSSNNNGNVFNVVGAVDGLREEAPGTPVSWLTPCPWGFDVGYMPEKDVVKLNEVRRLLQTCGWYHEGLSWQQSENLLKNAPVGRWLMRDSSDSRYTFAISVQTARGPTSVRVFYFMGKFRLDAEPRLALAMPLFDCPIKMLEYYCEYSKRMDEHRQEVWVDYSGQVYSQIYLSEPLLKEVRSLSHLARIAVNRGSDRLGRERERLPPVIKNYLNEYPYTL